MWRRAHRSYVKALQNGSGRGVLGGRLQGSGLWGFRIRGLGHGLCAGGLKSIV